MNLPNCDDEAMFSNQPELKINWDEPYSKATFLIADDNAQMVAALARDAKREGFLMLSDTISTHVLELAREHRPDVIVLDLHQAVEGRDLLADLKRDPKTRDLKVVILSGEEDQHARHECLRLGAEDYICKPVDSLFFRRLARIAMGRTGVIDDLQYWIVSVSPSGAPGANGATDHRVAGGLADDSRSSTSSCRAGIPSSAKVNPVACSAVTSPAKRNSNSRR